MANKEEYHKSLAADYDRASIEHVPCGICLCPTHWTGTARCDPCWNVESGLKNYLRSDRGRQKIMAMVAEMDLKKGEDNAKATGQD